MGLDGRRLKKFQRNSALEMLISDLNAKLKSANGEYRENSSENFAKVFLVGPPRSGSTLFMQWLATSGLVAYPTNLLSRFFGTPLVGAKIQQLLTDARYNFRDEILDFNSPIGVSSENGKTVGALAPNEFGYFWHRFLPLDEGVFGQSDQNGTHANLTELRDELNAIANIFEKPFAMKAMAVNENISLLADNFKKKLFVALWRDPVFNIQSVLEARKRQYGDINTWYSFKTTEYAKLKDLSPLEAVAGQIAAINRTVEMGIAGLPEREKLSVTYEKFCESPRRHFDEIYSRLLEQDGMARNEVPKYSGPSSFSNTNVWRLKNYTQSDANRAYQSFL